MGIPETENCRAVRAQAKKAEKERGDDGLTVNMRPDGNPQETKMSPNWEKLYFSSKTSLRTDIARSIAEHVAHARDKHPWPKKLTEAEKFTIVEREINELAAAMLKNDKRGTRNEALDAIAVLIRIVEGE
jgi:hypothetical protein